MRPAPEGAADENGPLVPQAIGRRLFEALFTGEVGTCFERSLALSKGDAGLRLNLHLNDVPELAHLPWELLYHPRNHRFLALSERTPIVRYLALPLPEQTLSVSPPLRILVVLAEPTDRPPIAAQQEWTELVQALGDLQARGAVVLERLAAPTLDTLRRRLITKDVHVLHFVGHGSYDPDQEAGLLFFEDDAGMANPVAAERLATVLHNCDSLRLVFLNACEGAVAADENVFTGVAQTLVQQEIPAAIAMQAPVPTRDAATLAEAFYSAVAANLSVDAALAQARIALDTSTGATWAMPVLFSRSADNRLFVLETAEDQATEPAPGEPPYKGLRYFDVADASLFHGREQLTAELVECLTPTPVLSQGQGRGDGRFLAVIGASGSGKSSLVRAGLVAALTGVVPPADMELPPGSEDWDVHVVTPTARPLESLAASLTRDEASVIATATLMDDLRADARSLHLHARKRHPNGLLLVVDQFEELFTLCRDEEARRRFVQNLLYAAVETVGPVRAVLTLRADFYAECSRYADLRTALERHQIYIGPMSAEELRRAIEQPAAENSWELEPGLVELMLQDVGDEPGRLPLLSHALLETWRRREGRTLTFQGYAAAGRVQGAIARTADRVYARLGEDQQHLARTIFLRLTELSEGAQDTRRRVARDELIPRPELANEVTALLQTLAGERARLVTLDGDEVEVAHEALIRAWPRLRQWRAEDREGLRVHRRLTEAAREWEHLDEDPGALYRGVSLQQALEWAEEHRKDLNELERRFLETSRTAMEEEAWAKERARQRELEQQRALADEQRKRAQIFRWAFGIVGALLLVAVGAALVAMRNLDLAQQQLNQQRGMALLQEARTLKKAGNVEDAIAQFEAAAAADPTLGLDLEAEIADVRRQVAAALVQEGEALARTGDAAAAEAKFKAALALDPPPDTPVYVYVPAGEFLMGAGDEDESIADEYGWPVEEEKPQHKVYLDAYWIGRTEVTNAQYRRCVAAGVCEPPVDGNRRYENSQFAGQPVAGTTWAQAVAYAEWVGGRLPSEAEWEKACRGGLEIPVDPLVGWNELQENPNPDRLYPWGDTDPDPTLLNYEETGLGIWVDVGSYPQGASPYGVYDAVGNVWEWTADWYTKGYYAASPERNPQGPETGSYRMLRGGSFGLTDNSVAVVRCAVRLGYNPDSGLVNLGFRVVWPSDF